MIEQRLKEVLERAAGTGPSEAGAYDRFLRRRRRATRKVTAATGVALVLVLGLAVVLPRVLLERRITTQETSPTSPHPTTSIGATHGGPPASFVTLVGKRIAVASTSTGKLLRFLTSANNPNLPGEVVVSEDRQWVYFARVAWCSQPGLAGLYRVPFAGGPVTRVTHSNLGRFAVSPDGSKLIYQTYRCPDVGHAPYGDLMLRDLANGTERRLPLPAPSLGGIAWGPDNRQVAMMLTAPDPGALWLLDTTTGQARQVRLAPPQILDTIALKWPAGSGQIVIVWDHPGGSNTQARVLYVDPATGTQTSLVLSKDRDARLNYLDVDASGQYLIYVLDVLVGRSATSQIWWSGGGKPVRLTRAYNQAYSRSPNEPGW